MMQILKRVESHYEVREIPFGKTYEWHPAYVVLECDCGEKLILTGSCATTTCRCGAELGAFVRDIQEREGRLTDKGIHPWLYDAQQQAEQHLRDEASYPRDSSWRYDDITSGRTNGE